MIDGILLFNPSDRPRELYGPLLVVTYDGSVPLPNTFADQFPFFKAKLESPKAIEHIIEKCCLLEDSFNGDETFVFHKVEHKDFGFVYTFKNAGGEEVEVRFCIESVKVD